MSIQKDEMRIKTNTFEKEKQELVDEIERLKELMKSSNAPNLE